VTKCDTHVQPDIRPRSYQFALRIIKLVRALPKDMATLTMARQLARSGTSIGANIEEAQGSHSRKEFAQKMNIARKEARECLYWLRLLRDSNTLPKARLEPLVSESDEIVRILVAIVKKTRGSEPE
jgi:four helix bundle protein